MGSKHVIKAMADLSAELYQLVNTSVDLEDGRFLHYGKVYQNYEECESTVGVDKRDHGTERGIDKKAKLRRPEKHDIDFRHENVDDVIVEEGRERLIKGVIDFCDNNRDGDSQSLMIACALNIYYSVGLFDRCGILPVSEFYDVLVDDVTKKYVDLIEKNILTKVGDYFWTLCERRLFCSSKVNKDIKEYMSCKDVKQKEKYLNEILSYLNNKAIREQKKFAEAILRDLDRFLELRQLESGDIINEMYYANESYQYAHLLMLLLEVGEFISKDGRDIRFVNRMDRFKDKNLSEIVLGIKSLESFDNEENEGSERERFLKSSFGFGIPYITFCSEENILNGIDNLEDLGECIYDKDEWIVESVKFELESNLGMPYVFIIDENVMKYTWSLAIQSSKSEKDKQKLLDEKKRIINGFSHTYMGMRATSLQEIAKALIKEDEEKFRSYGRKLLYEYSIKKNLSRDVEMLKMRFEDKIEELNDRIGASILTEESQEAVRVNKIISDALTRCMITLVHDGKAKNVREGFQTFDLIDIRNDFEQEVLLSDTPDIMKWFREKVFDLNFEISECWGKILFENDSYAALLLTDVITELIINIFKYADKTEPISIKFLEDEECLVIKTKNKIRQEIVKNFESGKGLEAEGDAIQVLNEINGRIGQAIDYGRENEFFKVKVSIIRSLFKV